MLFMPIPLLSLGAFSCFNGLQLLKTYANKAFSIQKYASSGKVVNCTL